MPAKGTPYLLSLLRRQITYKMAINQMNKLVWIVDTIRKSKKITFEELNRKWKENEDLSNGEELLKRTFHKWKESIADTFGLDIECDKRAPYYYSIINDDDLKQGCIENWILSTYAVSNSIMESKSIKDRIILEDVPSGREYLDPIIDAMKKNRLIHISYYNFWRHDTLQHFLIPLCVKLYRQRWYLVGRSCHSCEDRVYGLDRIKDFRLSSHTFEYPNDFDPQEFFNGCFGVISKKDVKIEDVLIKANALQANYIRSLPMMPNQEEIEKNSDFSIFKIRVRPTYDFEQELLWNRDEVEVLEPKWLRKEIAKIAKNIYNNNHTKK